MKIMRQRFKGKLFIWEVQITLVEKRERDPEKERKPRNQLPQ